jgi:hypothetical protein
MEIHRLLDSFHADPVAPVNQRRPSSIFADKVFVKLFLSGFEIQLFYGALRKNAVAISL